MSYFSWLSPLRKNLKNLRERRAIKSWRPRLELLEDRTVPTGLQQSPIAIYQPYINDAAFAPSTPGAGNTGTVIDTEGQTVVAGEHLLEFLDISGTANLTHLTATISWSDGSATTNITSDPATSGGVAHIEFLPGGGTTPGTNFAVVTDAANPHVYDAAPASNSSNLNFYVQVFDDGVLSAPAGTIQGSTPLNAPDGVADADDLAAGPVVSLTSNEGETLPVGTILATFTDTVPDGFVPSASEFTVTVNWGDGSSNTNRDSSNSVLIAVSGGPTVFVFTITTDTASHTYSEETTGSIPLTVTLAADAPGTATATANNNITINEVPVVINPVAALTPINEGAPLTGVQVATFTDPAGAELTGGLPTPGSYSATIDWGDGSASAGTITYISGNDFSVTGSHAYSDESAPGPAYQISVTVVHKTETTGPTVTTSQVVNDAPLNDTSAANIPTATRKTDVNVAQDNILVFSFDDLNPLAPNPFGVGQLGTFEPSGTPIPGTDYTITVTWNGIPTFVGTPSYTVKQTSVSGGVSHWEVYAKVTFAAAGTFTPVVTVTDDGGSSAGPTTSPISFAVNLAPTVAHLTAAWTKGASGFSGTLAISNGTTPYTGAAMTHVPPGLTPFIDSSGTKIAFRGVPTTAGVFTGTLTIRDQAGVEATGTFTITINAPPTFGPAKLATYVVNRPYTQVIPTAGGTGARKIAYALSAPLPLGLKMTVTANGALVISGIPKALRTVQIIIMVTDAVGARSFFSYVLTGIQSPVRRGL